MKNEMKQEKSRKNTTNHLLWKRIVSLLCMMTILSSLMAGCGSKEVVEDKNTDLLVEVTNPEVHSISIEGDFMGTVQAQEETIVIPKLSGQVTETYFEEGDIVQAGDLLFAIDDTSAKLALQGAEAGLKQAQASVETAQANVESAQAGYASTQAAVDATLGTIGTEKENIENSVENAQIALAQAETGLDTSEKNYTYQSGSIGVASEAYEEVKDKKSNLKKQLENTRDVKSKLGDMLTKVKNCRDNADWVSFAGMTGANTTGSNFIDPTTGAATSYGALPSAEKTVVDTAISEMQGKKNDADSAVSSLETAYDAAKSGVESADVAVDGAIAGAASAAANVDRAADGLSQAESALALAQQSLSDYESYAVPSKTAQAEASMASANAGMTSANAGVTSAGAAVTSSQVNVENAKLQLEYTNVKSPVTGVVQTKSVDKYGMAQAGGAAYVITSKDSVNIVFYVSERVVQSLQLNQSVKLERNTIAYEANISSISDVIDMATGLYKVEASIQGDTASLAVGSSVKVTTATQHADNVINVPIDCVNYENQKPYVYCMVDGKAVKTNIETGLSDNENIEIKSGITTDSQIITSWSSKLKDGVGVTTADVITTKDAEDDTARTNAGAETVLGGLYQ